MKFKKIFMTTLIVFAQAVTTPYTSYAAPASFYEAGDTIVREMSHISQNSFCSSLTFDSAEEVISFVDFFRKEYYNGNRPLVYKYADKSGVYKIQIEAPCSMETIASEHTDNTAAILKIAQESIGRTEEETVNNIASYVEEALYYDNDAAAVINQERAESVVGPMNRQYQAIGYSLTTGSAICYDYAMIAQRILQAAGIEAAVAMNAEHAFNLIRIEGQDYLYDLTEADGGYGSNVMKIPFSVKGMEMLKNTTGIDYTITSSFPNDYFEI